jgi:hypothetical protein
MMVDPFNYSFVLFPVAKVFGKDRRQKSGLFSVSHRRDGVGCRGRGHVCEGSHRRPEPGAGRA